MKSYQNLSETETQQEVLLTPSEVMEYLFCPRFTYFMQCLCIPQHEELRFKVLKGREVHKERARINREYLRKKLGCESKETSVYLASTRYHLKGIVDEVLHLKDGTLAPLDYKYAEYREKTFRTHKYQSLMYGLLIQDNYQKEVRQGFICYVRSKSKIKIISFSEKDFKETIKITNETLDIIQNERFPKKTSFKLRCIDCCYKNICV
jgi:CRISPR-associated exonuclease Cas4